MLRSCSARPRLWQPQVGAGDDQHEKCEVAGAGDGPARGAVLARGGQPPVPVGDRAEERAKADGAFAEDCAGVGVEQELAVAAERRRSPARHGSRGRSASPASPTAGPRAALAISVVDWQPRRRPARAGGQRRPLGPGDHLLLVGQQDAGDRHHEDHGAGNDAGDEVQPENEGAKGHRAARVGRGRTSRAVMARIRRVARSPPARRMGRRTSGAHASQRSSPTFGVRHACRVLPHPAGAYFRA